MPFGLKNAPSEFQNIMNDILGPLSKYSIVYIDDLSQLEVVDLLVKGFTGTLQSWWEKHLTDESRANIRSAVKTNEEGIPIFNEKIGLGDSDAVNTLFYTIVEHFIGTPSHLAKRL
jgi:hypothetical protein